MNNIVLDSSVCAKWFFQDEVDGEIALRIRKDFLKKEILISVPQLIFYEINNLLKTAIKSLRINKEKTSLAYDAFLDLDFIIYSSKDLMLATLEKAVTLDLSSYDASYVALSEYLNAPLFTSDKKLLKRAKMFLVKNLQEYS